MGEPTPSPVPERPDTTRGREVIQGTLLDCCADCGEDGAVLLALLDWIDALPTRVEVTDALNGPSECRVWRDGRLVFDGVSRLAHPPSPAGEGTGRLEELRKLSDAATPGEWSLVTEGCDCGGDYPCGHGEYPYAFFQAERHQDYGRSVDPASNECPGHEGCSNPYRHQVSEVCEFTVADAEFVVACIDFVRSLLADGTAPGQPDSGPGQQ